MLSAVQVLVTPQGKCIANGVTLGSETLWSTLQSRTVSRTAIVLMNKAAWGQFIRHILQWTGEREDNVPNLQLLRLSQRNTVLSKVPKSSRSELGRGGPVLLVVPWVTRARQRLCRQPEPIPDQNSSALSFPFVLIALLPTVLDNEWCS